MIAASSISQMLQIRYFAFLFCSLLFLFALVRYWKRFKTKNVDSKQPPGPWKLPLIGNLHQLIGPLPHYSLANLAKKYGPVMHLQLGELWAVVISSPEAAKEVLKTHELSFAQRPQVLVTEIITYDNSSLIFSPYSDYWRQMRKICVLELLSTKRVQSFKSLREQEVWNLIELISSSEGLPINLSKYVFTLTNNVLCRAAFGKKCKDTDDFFLLLGDIVSRAGGFNVPDLFPSLKFLGSISGMKHTLEKIQQQLDAILNDLINDCKMKRTDITTCNDESDEENLLDVLVKLQESGELDFQLKANHVKAVIQDMFSAGSETSASTIEWAMSEMLRNPGVMEKAQTEVRKACKGKRQIEEMDIENLDYLKLVVKETLRLHPLGALIPRECREECEISGFEIPVKAKVLINAWAIGRDPKYWKDADSFQPERFQESEYDFRVINFDYFPFGAGRRMCPGISFAIALVELALAQLLYHFDWKLDGVKPENLDMTEAFGLIARRKNNLYAVATTHIPIN